MTKYFTRTDVVSSNGHFIIFNVLSTSPGKMFFASRFILYSLPTLSRVLLYRGICISPNFSSAATPVGCLYFISGRQTTGSKKLQKWTNI